MEKRQINNKVLITLIIFSTFIVNISCSIKQIPIYVEKDSPSKPYLNSKYELAFQQFFHDSVKIFVRKKIIFSKYVETNQKYGVAPEICTIHSNILNTNNRNKVFFLLKDKKYKIIIKKRYSLYYMYNVDNKLYVQCTNVERWFH